METLTRLPDAELQVMRAIWALSPPAPTGAIRAELEKSRAWNLSALQTLLSRLVERGFLSTEKESRQRSYTPLVSENDYLAFENSPYLARRGVSRLVASLYESGSIGSDDLDELKAWLDKTTHRKE